MLQAKNKINITESDKEIFWQHFRTYMGDHPALGEHDNNPQQRWHQPIGIFGDDAKYTLAGRKIIILLLSSVLQKIERAMGENIAAFQFGLVSFHPEKIICTVVFSTSPIQA